MKLSDVQEKLLAGKYDLSVAATGVGAVLLRQLWEVPGASSFLRGFAFPYAGQETADYLGFKPEQYVSEETALELASRAYINARRHAYARGDAHLSKAIGIGITGSVASKEIHRGDHRVAIAAVTTNVVRCMMFYPEKKAGYAARCVDDGEASGYAIEMLGKCLGLSSEIGDRIIEERLRAILMKRPVFYSDGRREADLRGKTFPPIAYLSGSFNPLQDGHKFLAAHGTAANGGLFFYRICTTHVHKPALLPVEMLDCVAMMKAERKVTPWNYDECNLMFTEGDPLFVDKMRAEPGAIGSWGWTPSNGFSIRNGAFLQSTF